MPFTVEEKEDINRQKKNVYVENCLDKKTAMLKTLNAIKAKINIPLDRALDEENKKYKELIDIVNTVAEKLEKVLNHDVSKDEDVAVSCYKDEIKIRKLLDVATRNHELETVALGDEQVEDDEEVNDYTTLNQAIAHFYAMMGNGDDFENVPYQQAGELLHMLENLKLVYDMYDDLCVESANAVEYSMILQKIKEPEKYLNDFVKEKHEQLGDGFDYMKIDEFIEKQKQIYEKKQQEYINKEKEIDELKEKDLRVLELNQAGISLRDKYSKECSYEFDLGKSIDDIGNIMVEIGDAWTKYRAWEAESNSLLEKCKSTVKAIGSYKIDIDALKKHIEEYSYSLDSYIAKSDFNKKTKSTLKEYLSLGDEIAERKIFRLSLEDKSLNADIAQVFYAIKYNYSNANAKAFDNPKTFLEHLYAHVQTLREQDRNGHPDGAYSHALKTVQTIESLVTNYKIKPKDLLDTVGKDNEKILREVDAKIAELENKRIKPKEALDKNKEKAKIQEFISNYNGSKANAVVVQGKINRMEFLVEDLKEKYVEQNDAYEKHQKLMTDEGLSKVLADAFVKLDDICTKKTSQPFLADVMKNNKKRKTVKVSKDGKGKVEEYKAIYDKVMAYADKMRTTLLTAKKEHFYKVMVPYETDIAKNAKDVETAKKAYVDKNKPQLVKISEQMNDANYKQRVANGLKIGWEDQYLKFKSIKDTVDEMPNNRDFVIDAKKLFVRRLMQGQILSLYRSMNDARYWPGNSSAYTAMAEPFCHMLGKQPPGWRATVSNAKIEVEGPDFDSLEAVLTNLKEKAQDYIRAKGDRKKFNTRQRFQRISWANQLIAMCDNSLVQMRDFKQIIDSKLEPSFNKYYTKIDSFSGTYALLTDENGEYSTRRFGKVLNHLTKVQKEAKGKELINEPKGIFAMPEQPVIHP